MNNEMVKRNCNDPLQKCITLVQTFRLPLRWCLGASILIL